ncbi:hypothetical protein KIN20_004310 [Parelaphostrongylus tenuis]|uniref:Uncharacterized protein n=1 Tax=Parelaphostrongylus tenuis TaxID=148309 RepID=A0AAD5M2W7_PARTN|nr:hypothetical protein KIN20_004310 [Parelaphostrongylus tenuis]
MAESTWPGEGMLRPRTACLAGGIVTICDYVEASACGCSDDFSCAQVMDRGSQGIAVAELHKMLARVSAVFVPSAVKAEPLHNRHSRCQLFKRSQQKTAIAKTIGYSHFPPFVMV